jgi:arginyl-tRNA synthetase
MSIQEVSAEQLAELFHHYHQALDPEQDCNSKSAHESWTRISQQEKKRLVAAARLALLEMTSHVMERENSRRYYAHPGEAEWGC